MKKEYNAPTMEVVAVRTERLMNDGSFSINSIQTEYGAWSKEECDDDDFDW